MPLTYPAGTAARVNNAYNTTFGMPASVHLEKFDGTNWENWSGTLEAILALHEANDIILLPRHPVATDAAKWRSVQRRTKAYLCLYMTQEVYSLIASETDYPSFYDKWQKLKETYGGALGVVMCRAQPKAVKPRQLSRKSLSRARPERQLCWLQGPA